MPYPAIMETVFCEQLEAAYNPSTMQWIVVADALGNSLDEAAALACC